MPDARREPPGPTPPEVVVVGGGWAGLAAAVELSTRGARVTLLEAARQLGGRARRAPFDSLCVDNGQHLLMGAYRETLRLLDLLGVPEREVLLRLPLALRMAGPGQIPVELQAGGLPGPLHLLAALLACRGLSWRERLAALRLGANLRQRASRMTADRPVLEWLREQGQTPRLIENLWGPLCIATMNTPVELASARIFRRVLRDSLARRRADSDLLLPRVDMGRLLPDPAMVYVESRGGGIHLGERVTALVIEDGRLAALQTSRRLYPATIAILAASPTGCRRLLKSHAALADTAERIGELGQEPICTVYLRYPAEVRLGRPLLGLLGGTGQWVFDRVLTGQPGLLAVVISGPGNHMLLDQDALAGRVAADLRVLFPDWPAPLQHRVIREKRATFSCRTGCETRRPGCHTPVEGLWLAGDFTATGYPATLEGAVHSGVHCARAVLSRGAHP